MRFTLLALFLSAGTFCQAAQLPTDDGRHDESPTVGNRSTAPICLDKLFSSSPARPFTGPEAKPFSNLELFAPAQVAMKARSHGAEVDPKMIVRPPQAGLQQGIPIAQNEFPNLRKLPINSPNPNLQAIPAQWPNLKVQLIPTQWPSLDVHPVE